MTKPLSRPTVPAHVAERFWRLVDSSPGPNKCWPWKGNVQNPNTRPGRKPYGVWKGYPGTRLVHRIAYALHTGDSLDPEVPIHHKCHENPDHTPLCCNPTHLEPMEGAEHRSMHARERWEAHRQGTKRFRKRSGM